MPSPAILEVKKAPGVTATVTPKAAKAQNAATHGRFESEAVIQRRELAMLLRSIKTLVRQSP